MEGAFKLEANVNLEPQKITTTYNVLIKNTNNRFYCYIPAFDLTYIANNEDDITQRADKMVKSFVNFYFDEDSPKNFFIALHKLGFRTPNHNMAMKDALNKKLTKAKFRNLNNSISPAYSDYTSKNKQTELAVA